MSARYENLDQKPYESHYVYAETVIHHPMDKVWPQALKIGSWMSAHALETVAGEPGKVGHFERVLPRGLGSEVGLPHHHVYGIAHIEPFKYIALEVLPEKGGSYGNPRQWMSFDGILLVDIGERTKIIFLLVDVHLGKSEAGGYERRARELGELSKLLDPYFENLKQLVEEG